MTDKEKIRAEIERRKNLADKQEDNGYFTARSDAYAELLTFIDSMQEEPTTSVWHDKSEKPIMERPLVLIFKGEYENFKHKYRIGCYGCRGNNHPEWIINCCYSDSFIEKWAYIDDLLKL